MPDQKFLNLIKESYTEFILDEKLDELDDDVDFDEEKIKDEIEIEDNKDFLSFIRINIEDLIDEYLTDELSELDLQDFSIDIIDEGEELFITLYLIESKGEINFYDLLLSNLSSEQKSAIREAIFDDNFSKMESILKSAIKKENNIIYAEEETTVFNYRIPFEINNLNNLDKLEQHLDLLMISLKKDLESEDFFEME